MRRLTPLRYPGGKAQLSEFFAAVIRSNGLSDGAYVEPYAGGAGVAMGLLLGEHVDSVFINDIDPAVFSFWHSVAHRNDDLCRLIEKVPLTMAEWRRQRAVYLEGVTKDSLRLGFAMFFLNRTNRSGIMNGGVIGGKTQQGPWKIDARFNKPELVERVRRIGRYRSRIHVSQKDAVDLLRELSPRLPVRTLLYLDPPYYEKGQHLYTNYYRHGDHVDIAAALHEVRQKWVVTYDDHAEVRRLYRGSPRRHYSLGYTARDRRRGEEVMFFSPGLVAPRLRSSL